MKEELTPLQNHTHTAPTYLPPKQPRIVAVCVALAAVVAIYLCHQARQNIGPANFDIETGRSLGSSKSNAGNTGQGRVEAQPFGWWVIHFHVKS